jgi:hypothetical protein
MNTDDQAPRGELNDQELDALLDSADQNLLDYIQTNIDRTAALARIMTDSEARASASDQARRSQSVPSFAGRSAGRRPADPLIREDSDVLVVFSHDQDDEQDQGRSANPCEDEEPTAAATLVLSIQPTPFKGIARGTVLRSNRPRVLPAALALCMTSVAGIIGAVLTVIVRADAVGWLAGLAFTEIALALAGVLLITRRK